VTIVLATKPGINGANTLSIPTAWDATWFRKFIANSLQGADVRNAVGTNGVTVSGTIASPYATISLGAGPIIISPAPAAGTTLTVGGPTGGTAIATSNPGANAYNVLSWSNANGSGRIDLTAAGNTEIGSLSANTVSLFTNNVVRLLLSGTGAFIQGYGPTAGTLVDMTPDTGTFTITFTGFTASPTGTARWAKMGNIVCLFIPGATTGTSNATTFTATGIPAEITPSRSQIVAIPDNCVDNNSAIVASGVYAIPSTSSTITFSIANSSAGWTAAGTKGFVNSVVITYLLV